MLKAVHAIPALSPALTACDLVIKDLYKQHIVTCMQGKQRERTCTELSLIHYPPSLGASVLQSVPTSTNLATEQPG